jgi:hypothetical protein
LFIGPPDPGERRSPAILPSRHGRVERIPGTTTKEAALSLDDYV